MKSTSYRSCIARRMCDHVILVHEKLAKKREDRYVLNLALALKSCGSNVTILTSYFNKDEAAAQGLEFSDKIIVKYIGDWIPQSICGYFKSLMSSVRAAWMGFKLLITPHKPKPVVYIVDNSVVLCILKNFSKSVVFYLEYFRHIKQLDGEYVQETSWAPSLFDVKWMKYADEVIVENECYAELFRKLYPAINKIPRIFTPCVDIGLWNEPVIHIERIVPDLKKNTTMCLTVAKYQKSSNLSLAVEAFAMLMDLIKDQTLKDKVHLVVAGQCKTESEVSLYQNLVEETKKKSCASRVTFLRQLPTIHHKTLLAEATVVIHPSSSVLLSDFILSAMSLGKPIVAVNSGIAPLYLEHRVSGILLDPDPRVFAMTLHKLLNCQSLRMFLGEMTKRNFESTYSFLSFTKKMNKLIQKYESNGANFTDSVQIKSSKCN